MEICEFNNHKHCAKFEKERKCKVIPYSLKHLAFVSIKFNSLFVALWQNLMVMSYISNGL